MKSTLPGILEKAFPGVFDTDGTRSKHPDLGEDFFYQLAQNSLDIIFHAQIQPKLKFDYISPSCFSITGYRPEDFYNDPQLIKKIIHPEDISLIAIPFGPESKMPSESVEARWIRKDGIVLWMECMVTFTHDKAGNLATVQVTARDINERKKAQEVLEENQVFNASLLEDAPHATVVINPDTSIRYVNPAWVCLNGWTLSEVVGIKAPYPWWPAEFRDSWLETIAEKMKLPHHQCELPSVKKNGETYWIEISWSGVQKNGKLEYLLINSTDITERKKAEKALHDSEEKFSRAFNASPDIMAITTLKDNKFIEINDSFTRLTGYTREEALGRTSADINSWTNKTDRDKMLRMLKEQGRVYNEEFLFNTKSGEAHTMLFSVEQIKIGDEPCLISVTNDISQRKTAEAALKESEEKFSRVFTSSPNAMCLMGVASRKFTEVNDSFMRFTGYSREELIGRNHIDLSLCLKEEDQAFIGRALRDTGRIFNKRITCRTKSGELRFGLFSADSVDISGEKRFIIGITDISEQVKAEEALRESEEKFAKAFRDSPEIIAIVTIEDGKYVDVNESYLHYTGYSREEIIGKTTGQIDIWANAAQREERLKILLEQGRVTNKEYEFRTKSGEIRTWLYSAELLSICGEQCLMSASIDITERKRIELVLDDEATRRRILIEQSSDGIVIVDQAGNVYDVNQRFAEMLGYTMEEVLKLHVWDWEFGPPREELIKILQNLGAEGDHVETLHRRKDGSVLDVEISTNGATFAGQKLIFCVCRDISERRRMEKAVRESEEKFSLAFNASAHMISITDMEAGKYIEVNDAFVNNIGYTREELTGSDCSKLTLIAHPGDATKMMQRLQEQGCIKNEEYDFVTKSGDIHTWLCSADMVSIGGKTRLLAIAADITERKKAEEALRESEEKFSRAFNASPISLSISRMSDSAFLEVNESFLRDKGYTREEVIGRTAGELGIWSAPQEQNHLITSVKKLGRVHNEQYHYRTKSGKNCTGLVSAEVIKVGQEQCMLVLNHDITQQKQAEEQLRLLSSVTKQVSDSTIITDPDFKIQFINRAAEDMFGYSIEEVRGKKLSVFNQDTGTDEVKQSVRDALAAGKIYNAILTKRRKDGTTLICDCRLSPLYDENGKICSLIDVQRDITRQKDVEAKLQQHKKLIDSILATMPEGVLVIDSQDRIILANKAVHSILHLNGRLTKNKPLSEVLPLDQYFSIHRALIDGSRENNTLEFRYNVHGLEKIIYCVIVKMDAQRTLITFSDVSREREEEEKLYLTDRLASIGEMSAGLAHELNNPLTGILTLSQFLVNSDLPAAQKEDLECIYDEAKRAASIVKNVLLFARNKTDDTGHASVNEVVKDVLRLREYEERSSNIKVIMNLEEDLPEVPIDKGQLQQVFLNMLSNAEAAIKEADRPGILTVTSEHIGNHVNIYFSDNGCGIKKQVLPRIFDPFFTTKEVGKGTGLGLSICYSIIVKHGGKINVKSQVNEGTTFSIKMPIAN